MAMLRGTGVSDGIAMGAIWYYRPRPFVPDREPACQEPVDSKKERRRLRAAREHTARQLGDLADRARAEAGEDAALIFETHALLLEDAEYTACMDGALDTPGCTAERAARLAGEHFCALLEATGDAYMRERAADVRDVTARLLRSLTGEDEALPALREPSIVAADDLTPSETLQMDRSLILGFLTRGGSANSHTAILARTLGVPAVCGLGDALTPALHGHTACMDGAAGEAAVDPDAAVRAAFQERAARRQRRLEYERTLANEPDVTADGRAMAVCCNIAAPDDAAAVLASGAQGVGLFRSEFLFLSAKRRPTEEEQLRAYRAVAAAMGDRRTVIRTLDIGADKRADYLGLKPEANPALGLRGVRVCLNDPELFRTQLRALYRASAYGRVAILFPMIASVWEVRACRRLCRDVMEELRAEGIPFRRETELGVMIETPAAVLMADELAREADFFSIGTNDLTQYTLACDRQSGELGRFFDPHHPAVLRAVKLAADAAHRAGIWVGICGDAAADPALLETFLAIGVDELSVPPSEVLALRGRIRETDASACTLALLDGAAAEKSRVP